MSLFKKTTPQESKQLYQEYDNGSQRQGQHPLLSFKQMTTESKTDHLNQYQEVDPFQQTEAGKKSKDFYVTKGFSDRPKYWKVKEAKTLLTLAKKITKFKGKKGIIIEFQKVTINKNCRLQNKTNTQCRRKIWKRINPGNARNYWCVLDESTLEESDVFPDKWVDTSIEYDVFPDNVVFPNKTTFKQGIISREDLEKHFWLSSSVPLKGTFDRILIRAFIS